MKTHSQDGDIEKSDGLTTLGIQKLSESVRDYAYLILTSQTSTRGPIVGHEARNLDAQRTFLNTFENIVNRRVNIPEDIRRFQKTLQYARSKVDYAIGEFIYMLPSDTNLRIGNIRNYNNKILISSPSFNIGTNLKVNLDDDDTKVAKTDKLDVKHKPDIKPNKGDKQDVKPVIKPNKGDKQDVKPVIKPNKEHKQDVKPNRPDIKQNIEISRVKPDTNKITYEEEKAALILGMMAVFTAWFIFSSSWS